MTRVENFEFEILSLNAGFALIIEQISDAVTMPVFVFCLQDQILNRPRATNPIDLRQQ